MPEEREQGVEDAVESSPKYWPSRSVEEWRAYHRDYYQRNAAKRRQQARKSYLRRWLRKAFGGHPPKSVMRIFLRE